MKSKHEKAYFNKEWDEMQSRLAAFLKTENQNDLHRFRVQVKKIRAFLILADSLGSQPKLTRHFKPVRKIFKHAGDIRNAYMNLELVKEHHVDDDAFVYQQQQLMENAAAEFKLKGNKYLKKAKAAHQALKEMIRPIATLHIDFYYKNQLQKIAGMLVPLKFDDELHRCRGLVKILIYNFECTRNVLETGFNEDYLEQIQTAVGDWHDNILATELFTGIAANNSSAAAHLKKQQVKLENNIKKLAPDFYNRATTAAELPVEQIS